MGETPKRSRRLPLLLTSALLLGGGGAYLASGPSEKKPALETLNNPDADKKTPIDALVTQTKKKVQRAAPNDDQNELETEWAKNHDPNTTHDPEINKTFENQLNWLAINYKHLPKTAIKPEINLNTANGPLNVILLDDDYDFVRKKFKKIFDEIIKQALLSDETDRDTKITQIMTKLGIDKEKLADLALEIYQEEMAEFKETKESFAEEEEKAKARGHNFDWENEQLKKQKEKIDRYLQFANCVRDGKCEAFPTGTALD